MVPAALGVAALAAAAYLFMTRTPAVETYADGSQEAAAPPDDGAQLVPDPQAEEDYSMTTPEQRIDAFVYMLRCCENTAEDVAAGNDFHRFYGGGWFQGFADHPVLTGELRGVPLAPATCKRAGIASGNCVSTAAGAGQINVPTWREVRSWGGPRLPDFSPESQLEAIRRILRKIGAASLIEAGDVQGAIGIAGQRWASLPGARGGQGQRSLDFALSSFDSGLAVA